jgi:tetratricopeptide (TPR) repeat protein
LVADRPTLNQEAYDLYLRARAMFQNGARSRDDMEKVIALCEQSVAKDPAFAVAHAQLAYLHGRMYWYADLDQSPARRDRAKAALDTALRLAPNRSETHLAAGAFAYYCDNDWERALAEFRAAEVGLPNDAQLIYFIGLSYRRMAQLPEAITFLTRAFELNPHDVLCAQQVMQSLTYSRRYPELIAFVERALTLFPDTPRLRGYLSSARLELDHDLAAYFRTDDRSPSRPFGPTAAQFRYARAMERGDLAAADQVLANSQSGVLSGQGGVISDPTVRHRALVAFLLGKPDAARAFADEAVAYYRNQSWPPRATAAVMVGMALSDALAGRGESALKLARDAVAWQLEHDRFAVKDVQEVAAQVYLVLDRRDEALAALRDLFNGPSTLGPEHVRLDPLWKRVKDDPRFEEILKSAKPL